MRKFFKYLFIIIASIAIIVYLAIYLYKGVVINNLTDKNKTVTETWSEVYNSSNDRLKLLETLVDNSNKGQGIDSLRMEMQSIKGKQNLYRTECSIEFVKKEYDLNKVYLSILKKYSNDSILKQNLEYKRLMKLKEIDSKSNVVIDQYNAATLDYNKYISIFPNFYFAKSNGFHKRKYFSIKYGIENEDPIAKSKELPTWAKEQDTL